MASMPLEIPLKVTVKGLKALALGQQELATALSRLLDGQMILAEVVGSLREEVRDLVTNVERLGTTLENIQGDITNLKEAATTKADADAATIAQLRSDVDAATAQKGVDDSTITQLNQAVADAEASLASAQADFDASLNPLVTRADEIDAQTPAPEEPAPPVTPEEPAPPVEEPPAPPVEEPAPPVEEPAPADPNAPVDGNVEPV